MGQGFFSKADVMMRLNGTVCMYKGDPVLVKVSPESPCEKVDIFKLSEYDSQSNKNKKITVDYTENSFDYKAPPLGYAFISGKKATYVTRVPVRQQSQGLSNHVLKCSDPNNYLSISASYMHDCIKGNYPSAVEAVRMVASGLAQSVPFDRRFAVTQMRRGVVSLACRGKDVGMLVSGTEDNPKFKLFAIKEAPLIAGALKGKVRTC